MDTVQEYRVFDGKEYHAVKSYDVDPMLRKIQARQLKKFIENGGKIRPVKLDNGDYVLRANVPGLGGGIVVGLLATFATAIVGTGATLVATVAAIPSTGPGALAVLAAGAAATVHATTIVAVVTLASPTP